jgi:hypothetical protein
MVASLLLAAFSPCAAQSLQFSDQRLSAAEGSRATLVEIKTPDGNGVALTFQLAGGGWANASAPLRRAPKERPVTFLFRTTTACTLELKFVDSKGGTFGQQVAIEPAGNRWRRLTIYQHDAKHLWGGDGAMRRLASFDVAVSGRGAGTLSILRPMIGKAGEPSSFGPPPRGAYDAPKETRGAEPALFRAPYDGPLLDPDRGLAGYGTRQRRAKEMIPEDPLVLEWLKQMQDTGTPDRRLLPSTPGGDEGHTFNNVLATLAFIRHRQRERAERILDFFRDAAADRHNDDPLRQSFYLRGEARGFFQRVSLHGRDGVPPMHAPPDADRWMGDMAWLLLACLDHQRTFDDPRYAALASQIAALLRGWYIANPTGKGGYVRHGWRRGDTRLHEDHGHHEGNIDCYAAFTRIGEHELAQHIRTWLEAELVGRTDLPLDLYTWRVLAFGGRPAELLDVPEFDLRYRKTVAFRGRTIVGPYSGPAPAIDNIWLEGAAHLACAYAAAGNVLRANFYANQLDAAIIDQHLGGKFTHSLPYCVNRSGDYGWVNPDEGFTSTAAWYVLAKHRFNPLRLESGASADSRLPSH